jgi:WhiB family redox-sensing transcriptional regulator
MTIIELDRLEQDHQEPQAGLEGLALVIDEEQDEERWKGTHYARCADGNGTLTRLFFSDDEFDIARAKAICAKCGLAPDCLASALERAEAYGVWGGELLIDGVIVKVKRGRGRPPKTPRPVLVVDEVPIPPHLVA